MAKPLPKEKPIVLITGAAGNIGRSMATKLADDYQIVGLDRPGSNADFRLIEADLGDDKSVSAALKQFREQFGRQGPRQICRDRRERPHDAQVRQAALSEAGGQNRPLTFLRSPMSPGGRPFPRARRSTSHVCNPRASHLGRRDFQLVIEARQAGRLAACFVTAGEQLTAVAVESASNRTGRIS
jgi:NAD(P)-dependent dehydrogenase (short-subunit alcohol dehydrogenase family)